VRVGLTEGFAEEGLVVEEPWCKGGCHEEDGKSISRQAGALDGLDVRYEVVGLLYELASRIMIVTVRRTAFTERGMMIALLAVLSLCWPS